MPLEEARLVASNEARLGDQIGSLDRIRPETEVRNSLGARFVRIVNEIALGVAPGILGDDFHAVLVGPDRSVGAEAVEDRAGDAVGFDREAGIDLETRVRHIVIYPDGEAVPCRKAAVCVAFEEFVERRFRHRGSEIL